MHMRFMLACCFAPNTEGIFFMLDGFDYAKYFTCLSKHNFNEMFILATVKSKISWYVFSFVRKCLESSVTQGLVFNLIFLLLDFYFLFLFNMFRC